MSVNAPDLAGPASTAPPTKAVEAAQFADTGAGSERVTVIEPGRAERNYWLDLWRYRELFAILAWRDVSVRYKQTVIGVAWALIRPFLTTVVFTIIFGQLAKLPSEGDVPYPIMVFAGLMPWFLFASVLERFLGLYVSVNSFSQMVARTKQGEVLKTWKPRAGGMLLH